jgi:3-hydroxyacyl-CoA dehydrogenase
METRPFDTIGIVGAGTMGAQISLLCVAHGRQVWLWSRSEQTLQRAALSHVQDLEKRRTPEEKSTILDRIHLTSGNTMLVSSFPETALFPLFPCQPVVML